MNVRVESTALQKNMNLFASRVLTAVDIYCGTVAKDFEKYAKQNRVWTDRTSSARIRLTGYVEKGIKSYRIVISHGVDYGIWLELANEKRFAILEPTIRLKGPEAIEGLRHLLNRI